MNIKTKVIILFVLLFFIFEVKALDIPNGVNYKRAYQSTNEAASKAMLDALNNPNQTFDKIFGKVTVCGPMLWKALKPKADMVLLKALPLNSVVSIPEPKTIEGKRIQSKEERQSFWHLLFSVYPELKNAKVRAATANEISFYWAIIPFDIEEPFFSIDAGQNNFIVNFTTEEGKPTLFWIDRVDDLRTLNTQ